MSMPGERLGGPDSPVIKLILAMEKFGKRFPGFEREVHGIEPDSDGNYWMRAVVEEPAKRRRRASKLAPESGPPAPTRRLKDKPIRHSTS
jgi:arginine decarboxylase